jgi:hypothetical protein
MLLVSVLLIGLACLALTMLAALQIIRQERALRDLEVAAARHRAEVAERQLFAQSRNDLASAGTSLALPVEVTQATHQGIAAIPFGILEQIPATAERTKAVRQIHDEISRGVYQALSGTTRGIAGLVRGGRIGPTQHAPRPVPRPGPIPGAERPAAVQPADNVPELEQPRRRRPRPGR